MNEIAILRFAAHEGPGTLVELLDRHRRRWRLIRIDRGEAVPADLTAFSGLVLMGGPMSGNDDLPWIEPVCALVRQAVEAELPLLGICLGSQLVARALGGAITRNPVPEIGWLPVRVAATPEAAALFAGLPAQLELFHWHGETFSLPPGARLLLSSDACANQGFALGRTIALQCHVEVTAAMVRDWATLQAREIAQPGPTVQSATELVAHLDARVERLRAVAELVCRRWLQGIGADRTP